MDYQIKYEEYKQYNLDNPRDVKFKRFPDKVNFFYFCFCQGAVVPYYNETKIWKTIKRGKKTCSSVFTVKAKNKVKARALVYERLALAYKNSQIINSKVILVSKGGAVYESR